MATRDLMTVKGIGKKERERLYRSWYNDEEGILYYEDKKNGLLIRQALPIKQDLELIKITRRTAAKNLILSAKDKNGKDIIITADKVLPKETNEELLKLIKESDPKNNDRGSISLLVFNFATKEFIVALDVDPLIEGEYQKGGIIFTFSDNLLVRKKYENRVKRWVNSLLIEKGVYPGGCKEAWYNGTEYIFLPIP